MWSMHRIEREDYMALVQDSAVEWQKLHGRTVLISGATGLIGKALTNALLYYAKSQNQPLQVVALVRDVVKAKQIFAAQLENGAPLRCVRWQAEEKPEVEGAVDYVFHCASQTSSKGFMETPVETIKTAFLGTEHILALCREKKVKKMVYLSTMEVYGTPQTDEKIYETHVGQFDAMSVRNCYPKSKSLCENLCISYASEYGVPVCIARLTQTFGPGVSKEDGRVFAEFACCAMREQDIVLHTKGETKRSYLYTMDAVSALLILALRGENGQAYNVANEETYCSIYEMAQMVAAKIGKNRITVRVNPESALEQFGYAPVLHINLDTARLRRLGWSAKKSLPEMFERMIIAFGGE